MKAVESQKLLKDYFKGTNPDLFQQTFLTGLLELAFREGEVSELGRRIKKWKNK